jgi:hypothetical protein
VEVAVALREAGHDARELRHAGVKLDPNRVF